MSKLKVLCICAKGANRSKYLAGYLETLGYETKYGGIDPDTPDPVVKYATQEDVNWADIIIIVRERLLGIFKNKYNFEKRIIVLDVSDKKSELPEELKHLENLEYNKFQEAWTYPNLRNAIKPYLPL